MPLPVKRLSARARPVLLPAVILSPSAAAPALEPLSSMRGKPAKPGWVVPSMVNGFVIAGNGLTGIMVRVVFVMAKEMVLGPAAALASRMAWRSEPLPLSLVVTTLKGAVRPDVTTPTRVKTQQKARIFISQVIAMIRFSLVLQEKLLEVMGEF